MILEHKALMNEYEAEEIVKITEKNEIVVDFKQIEETKAVVNKTLKDYSAKLETMNKLLDEDEKVIKEIRDINVEKKRRLEQSKNEPVEP